MYNFSWQYEIDGDTHTHNQCVAIDQIHLYILYISSIAPMVVRTHHILSLFDVAILYI